jgi:LPS-assembly protein
MTIVRVAGILLFTGLLAALTAEPAHAQFGQRRQTESGGGKIDITADKLSAQDGANRIEATGSVEIKRDETTLKADEVRMNRETQDIEAKGKISLDDPEWKVRSADEFQFNMGKETGQLKNAELFIEEGHISMSGRRMEKFEGQTYHVDEGFFTTCLCEPGSRPSWKFSADEMEMTLRGLGTVKNGYFYVMDVPVFYIPYAFFPLRTERQTGLLSPSFGHSTKEGFRFLQPFFWAISRSTDATIAFDIESKARVGVLGEYRTIFQDLSDFRFNAAYFNETFRKNPQDDVVDRTIADQHIPKDRWNVVGTHRYMTAADWLTYSDFAAYSDDLFARELFDRFDLPASQESNIRVSRFGESRMGLFRGWTDTFLRGEVKFYQDFIQFDKITLQRTPQLAFWGRRFFDSFPLELRWRTEGMNYIRRHDGDGLRLDLQPELVLPYNLTSYFFGDISVAPRGTVYHLYTPVNPSTRNPARAIVELQGNIGTSFSRVFDWNIFGVKGVKHVIEPRIQYQFVPGVNQSDIPIMDQVDRVRRRNLFTFSVTNRFWGKPANPVASGPGDVENLSAFGAADLRDLGAITLAMGYDINKGRKGGDSLTDIDVRFRLDPAPYIRLTVDGGIDPGAWNINQARATFALQDPRPLRRTLDADFNRPNMLSIGYSFLRSGPNGFLAEDANIDLDSPANCALHPDDPRCAGSNPGRNIIGSLSVTSLYHLLQNVVVYFNSTYDARDSKFIGFSTAGKLLSSCECWAITLGVRRNVNPAKTSFNVDFNLLGIGAPRSTLK